MYGGRRRGGQRSGGYGGRGGRSGGRRRPQKNEFGISHGQPGANLKPLPWHSIQLKPFRRNFYTPVNHMNEQQVLQWRASQKIEVSGNGIPQPLVTFEQSPIPPNVLQSFHNAGFTAPTPIQAQGWPMALIGRNMVGIAQTGSGKTLAFIIPAVIHIMGQPPLEKGDGPIALCVAPTRELACQIQEEAKRFAAGFQLGIGCVYGGAPKRQQQYMLNQGVDLLICTPGRMLDFLENRVVNCKRVTYLVFDEADRMLDMGFEPQIRLLVSQVRPDRQVLMWSATWPNEVQNLANDFLGNDILMLRVGSKEGKAVEKITQHIHIVGSSYEKDGILEKSMAGFQGCKMLIFTATKRMADNLARRLYQQGWNTKSIHGDKQQYERDRVLAEFKSGRINIMVATDVAARGLHVEDIAVVINYDFPNNCDDYIHRIGRTARAGRTGTSISFFNPKVDSKKGRKLIKILKECNQVIPDQLYSCQNYSGKRNSRFKKRGRGRGRRSAPYGRGGRGRY